MVFDPFFTLPLLAAAIVVVVRRADFRRAFSWGVLASATYLAVRVVLLQVAGAEVRRAYPQAESVSVFPSLFGVTRFRYIATVGGEYRAGSVAAGSAPAEEARARPFPTGALPARLSAVPKVREALEWARFPVVRVDPEGDSGYRVEVADLRYHLRGKPTLAFVVSVAKDGHVSAAHLERGGSVRELFERYRAK